MRLEGKRVVIIGGSSGIGLVALATKDARNSRQPLCW
jgi:NAD(P)-dependent dehydrogenase (short-subunit alcohol dehydrogenase family)